MKTVLINLSTLLNLCLEEDRQKSRSPDEDD